MTLEFGLCPQFSSADSFTSQPPLWNDDCVPLASTSDCGLSTSSNDPMQQVHSDRVACLSSGVASLLDCTSVNLTFTALSCETGTRQGGDHAPLSRYACSICQAPRHSSQSAWVTATIFVRVAGCEGFPSFPPSPLYPDDTHSHGYRTEAWGLHPASFGTLRPCLADTGRSDLARCQGFAPRLRAGGSGCPSLPILLSPNKPFYEPGSVRLPLCFRRSLSGFC